MPAELLSEAPWLQRMQQDQSEIAVLHMTHNQSGDDHVFSTGEPECGSVEFF